MKRIRVFIANSPTLMREAVRATIIGEPDFEIVGESSDETSIVHQVERTRPDYLVVSLDSRTRPALCGFLLGRFPYLRILAVTSDGNGVEHYWAQVELRSQTVDASPERMLGLMRENNVGEVLPAVAQP